MIPKTGRRDFIKQTAVAAIGVMSFPDISPVKKGET
jgi:hypothetical protein